MLRTCHLGRELILFSTIFIVTTTEVQAEKMISSGSIYFLSVDEISDLSKKSLEGNSNASMRLYKFYSLSSLDEAKASYWLKISAGQGDWVAQYNYALSLIKRGDLAGAQEWASSLRKIGKEDEAKKIRDLIIKKGG
jgi:hypothetical protein